MKLISGGTLIIILVICLSGIRFMIEANHRNRLPLLPDLSQANPMLREQITQAHRNAVRRFNSVNLGTLGMIYNSSSYYEEATRCYRLAAEKDKNSWQWNYYLGYLDLELGNSEEATANFHEVIKRNPGAFNGLYYIGGAWQNLNIYDSSLKYHMKVAGMNDSLFLVRKSARQLYYPLPVYSRFELARIYMATGSADKAEDILKSLIVDEPSFGPAYRQLGILYSEKGNTRLSDYYSIRANDLAPYSPPMDTIIDRITLLSRSEEFLLKQIDNAERGSNSYYAITLLKQGLRFAPDNRYFISRIVKAYLTTGNIPDALPYLENHLKLFKNDFREVKETGYLLLVSGFKDQAKKYLRTASELTAVSPGSLSEVATWICDAGEQVYAAKFISGLIDSNPENPAVIADAVYIFLSLQEQDKALGILNRLRKLQGSEARVKFLEAVFAEQEGRITDAMRLYEQSLDHSPGNRHLTGKIISYNLQEKNWEKSLAIIRKSMGTFPNDPDLQEKLGRLLIECENEKLRNISEGIDYSERAFFNKSSALQIRVSAGKNLATGYRALGEKKLAYLYISKAIEMAKSGHAPMEFIMELSDLSDQILSDK